MRNIWEYALNNTVASTIATTGWVEQGTCAEHPAANLKTFTFVTLANVVDVELEPGFCTANPLIVTFNNDWAWDCSWPVTNLFETWASSCFNELELLLMVAVSL